MEAYKDKPVTFNGKSNEVQINMASEAVNTERPIVSSTERSPEPHNTLGSPAPILAVQEINLIKSPALLPQKAEAAPADMYPVIKAETSEKRRLCVQLTWENVCVWCPIIKEKKLCSALEEIPIDDDKLILKHVSGSVMPGQFLSIIGASGAGKTTLLQYLSGKMLAHNLKESGTIMINGNPRDSIPYSRFTAFVQQDDILMETLSIRESLLLAADVKTAGTKQQKKDKVELLIHELELVECADMRFGSDIVTKGEKKRASMGVELVTDPSLIFVDEPTTGMDAFTATSIVNIMKELAKKKNKTVIATIHQPSTDIYNSFDQLMILALGRTIYFNTKDQALQYFHSISVETYDKLIETKVYTSKYPLQPGEPQKKDPAEEEMKAKYLACPSEANPAEYFMKKFSQNEFYNPAEGDAATGISLDKYKKMVRILGDLYDKNPLKCDIKTQSPKNTPIHSAADLEHLKAGAPWVFQFWHLLIRAWKNTLRLPQSTIVRYFTTLFTFALGTALYYQIPWYGYEAVQSRVGSIMYLVTFCFLEAIQNVILVFPEERAVFLRDQASSLYDISAYFVSKVAAEFPLNLSIPLVAILFSFWLWDLNNVHHYIFFVHLIHMELVYFIACAIGLVIGSIVSERSILITLNPVIVLPMALLSGFFVNINGSTWIMRILQYISPFKYGLSIGLRAELEDSKTSITLPVTLSNGRVVSYTTTSEGVLDSLDLEVPNWACYLILVAMVIGIHFAAFMTLRIFGKRV